MFVIEFVLWKNLFSMNLTCLFNDNVLFFFLLLYVVLMCGKFENVIFENAVKLQYKKRIGFFRLEVCVIEKFKKFNLNQ